MKSLIKIMYSSLLLISMALMSCGGADYKTIDKKIEDEGVSANFTDHEYGIMFDYCEKSIAKLSKISKSSSDQKMKEIEAELENNSQSLMYFTAISEAAEKGRLNETDQKRFKKLHKSFELLLEQINGDNYSQYNDNEYENTVPISTKTPIKISSPNAFQGYYHEFTGKIGTSSRINMHLDLENYTGHYYILDDSTNSHHMLRIISYDPETTGIQILDTDENGGTLGIFQGYITSAGELYGTYTNEYGEEYKFHVEVNDAP